MFSLQIFTRNILTNTSFLNKVKVKFLQLKQVTIRQKCCHKHKKRWGVPRVHMKRDTSFPCTQLCIFWMTPPFSRQLRTYLIDGPFLNQKTYKDIRILYSLKYKRSKKSISLRKKMLL